MHSSKVNSLDKCVHLCHQHPVKAQNISCTSESSLEPFSKNLHPLLTPAVRSNLCSASFHYILVLLVYKGIYILNQSSSSLRIVPSSSWESVGNANHWMQPLSEKLKSTAGLFCKVSMSLPMILMHVPIVTEVESLRTKNKIRWDREGCAGVYWVSGRDLGRGFFMQLR